MPKYKSMAENNSSWIRKTLPLWIGQFVSLFGSGIVQFSIVWYLTEKTGSKVVLAFATYTAIVPGILLGSAIGHFVDSFNRKFTMIIADFVSAAMILIMVILLYYNVASTPLILLLMLIRSISNKFQGSALFASIPQIVPERSLEKVAGLRQTMDGILSMVSIPIAAFLLSIWSIHSILSIDIITAIIGILLLLLFVKIPGIPISSYTAESKNISKLIEGFKLLFSYKYIFFKSLLSASINLVLTPSITFLPLLVKNIIKKGPETLALLQVSFGIGLVLGGLIMSCWGGFKKRTITVLLGLGVLGISLLSGGIITNLGFSNLLILPIFFIGISLSISNSSSGAITQSKVKSKDIGKVSGASSSISQLMIPFGLLIATPVSEFIGLTGWFILGGSFCIVVVIFFSFNKSFLEYSFRGEKAVME